MKKTLIQSVLAMLLIQAHGGCATTSHFEAIYGSWVGRPLASFEAAYGPLEQVGIEGENRIYTYKMKRMKDCTIFWSVDGDGIIVKWRHEGTDCKLAPFS